MATKSNAGRPATGWCKYRNGKAGLRWYTQITLKSGKRSPWIKLPKEIPEGDEAGARAAAKRVSDDAREGGLIPKDVTETTGEWFKRFHEAKEAKGLATVGEMRGRAKKWILPGIEDKDIRSVTSADVERIVARLDRVVAAWLEHGPGNGRLAPATAVNVWGDLQHAFEEAVRAKDPGLRVLTESPARNVRGPEGGDERPGQILYSDEVIALLRGAAVDPSKIDVPLYRRQVYAVAIYLKARSSELEAITPADVDLAHATITISKQVNQKAKGKKKGTTKKTKTGKTRTVDIEPNLYAFVEWLTKHPQGKNGRLLHMPPPEDRAELVRKDLLTVGVTREALHLEGSPLERAITLHDLRDTGLTHMALRGDSPILIQWAGGHTDFKTTQGYIDRGRVEARRIGAPLPPLPPELFTPSPETTKGEISSADLPPEEGSGGFASISLQSEIGAANPLDSLPFQRPQWELNPCYRRERPAS